MGNRQFIRRTVVFSVLILSILGFLYLKNTKTKSRSKISSQKIWTAPDTNNIARDPEGRTIRYGRELILHTARYFGPKGTIAQITNGMNCDNCHIDGGTRIFGNNFSMVASTYPVYRNRNSKIETVEMRVNNCFERSLNGSSIEDSGKEMKSIVAYMNWVGKDVNKRQAPNGSGIENLAFLDRKADTKKGEIVFVALCQKCHGNNGEGKLNDDGKEYLYPPLWGEHSYNIGSGIYELSKFAGYAKNNMPFGFSYKNPQLTNEQAWDVAAFVNSKPHPGYKYLKMDWHNLSTKPIDYPFGPYFDSFSESQHKYGPFKPIILAHEKMKKNS